MKKELVDLQPKLEEAKIDNTNMMKVDFTSSFSLIIDLEYALNTILYKHILFNFIPSR